MICSMAGTPLLAVVHVISSMCISLVLHLQTAAALAYLQRGPALSVGNHNKDCMLMEAQCSCHNGALAIPATFMQWSNIGPISVAPEFIIAIHR